MPLFFLIDEIDENPSGSFAATFPCMGDFCIIATLVRRLPYNSREYATKCNLKPPHIGALQEVSRGYTAKSQSRPPLTRGGGTPTVCRRGSLPIKYV